MDNKNYILRDIYLEKVKPLIGQQLIKVFTGQRRIGKSFVMLQTADFIRSNNGNANIIYIDKELFEFSDIIDAHTLNLYVEKNLNASADNFLFIDEVQEIEHFELCLRSLLNQNKCDIYCSGSNAKILSGELATHLNGRYIELKINALTFKEYIKFNNLNPTKESLKEYLTFGGMPYLTHIAKDKDLAYEYLKNVYSTILLHDVVARQSIRNIPFLESLVAFLADNVGNLFSAKNISDYLKSQNIKIAVTTVQDYLSALCNAFIIHKVQRIDIQGFKIFEINDKYYFEDWGIRNALRGYTFVNDINKLMENIVYQDLISRGYEVYVGQVGNKEIDFTATKSGERIYVQVAYLLSDESVVECEFGNLMAIKDNFPKYVVSMDDFSVGGSRYKGIIHQNLLEFLLNQR